MKFADRVVAFMQRYEYRASEFGRAALNDPNFVTRILHGNRSPTERVMEKVQQWMDQGPEVHAPEKRHPIRIDTPPRAHRAGAWGKAPILWSERDDKKIRRMIRQGKGWVAIGDAFGVSARSARRHAIEIGAAPPPRPRHPA